MAIASKDFQAYSHLIKAYHMLCPTDYDREAIVEMHKEMKRDRLKAKERCKRVAYAITDGLAYGNWPSAIRQMRG